MSSLLKNHLFNHLKNKSILITSHSPVDIDGFVSCLLLKLVLKSLNQSQFIYIYCSELSKNIIDYMNNFIKLFPEFDYDIQDKLNTNIDLILILDTNNLDIIQTVVETTFNVPFIFIDHHLNLKKNYPMNLESLNIIDDSFTSTAEIIFEIIEHFQLTLPIPYKYLLASAILADSAFLKYGNNKTLVHLTKIMENDIEYQDVIGLLNIPIDLSERIAKIKGLQRVKLIKINNWLIGISHVSSYGASVASMLINIGFDISIVYSKEKTGYRITARANKSICLKTGLHLGQILYELSAGKGGGHEGAASLNTKVNIEPFLEQLLDSVKKILLE